MEHFLSCLHGSELGTGFTTRGPDFLSCLHGSELGAFAPKLLKE